MFTVKHPLENINSFDEIMKLPYFEFVTCFGHFCMHPGGLDKTIELFEEAGIQESDRVLEIGSGNGFTTSLLMDAGINVSVVEPNPYLLQTTLNLCFKNHKKTPTPVPAANTAPLAPFIEKKSRDFRKAISPVKVIITDGLGK